MTRVVFPAATREPLVSMASPDSEPIIDTLQCSKKSDYKIEDNIPPPPRRVGASAKPLTVYTVTEHPAMLVAMFASPRRIRGGSGCLKSESEERETWTAESLRAAFRAGESLRANGQDETSAVDVSGQHLVA